MGGLYQACGEGGKHADYVVALAGNPNTGKSTLFNALTGLNQHTGNWPGKTVLRAEGIYVYHGKRYRVVDLPGTYSLLAHSPEEEVARDYLCFAQPQVAVAVVDATCLERNLNLVLQLLEITSRVVVCVNLLDEAKRKKLRVDIPLLAKQLGVPVVGITAREKQGLDVLLEQIEQMALGKIVTHPYTVHYSEEIETSIQRIEPQIRQLVGEKANSRWLALRLLEGDIAVIHSFAQWLGQEERVLYPLGGEILA